MKWQAIFALLFIGYSSPAQVSFYSNDTFYFGLIKPEFVPQFESNQQFGAFTYILNKKQKHHGDEERSMFGYSSLNFQPIQNIAGGLTQFYIDRAKQELGLSFFKKLKTNLGDGQKAVLGHLFPTTSLVLNAVDENLYEFKIFIQSLRTSCRSDLSHLPENILKFASHSTLVKDKAKLALVSDAYFLLSTIERGGDIHAAFEFILGPHSEVSKIGGENEKLIKALISLYRDFVISSQHKRLKKGKSVVRKSTALKELHRNYAISVENIKAINAQLSLTPIEKLSSNFTLYHSQLNHFVSIFEIGTSALVEHKKDIANEFIFILRFLGDIILSVKEGKFTDAVTYTFILLDKLVIKNKDSFERGEFLKYTSFIASLAEASNISQANKIIQYFAVPAGRTSIKRNHDFSIFLNGYTGINYGWEYLGLNSSNNSFYGMRAPLGLAFSYSMDQRISLSLFFNFIDIGVLTAFRVNNDLYSPLPDFNFHNILAPGIFLDLGFGQMPFSIAYGIQKGPNLRSFKPKTGNDPTIDGWNHQFSVNIDVPLAVLYKSKK